MLLSKITFLYVFLFSDFLHLAICYIITVLAKVIAVI